MPITKARLRISDYNQKRKARLTKQEKRLLAVSLSLTSMVDMFAILVIFLLASSTSVSQWIQVSHHIELPQAKFTTPPPKAATIQVSQTAIYGGETRLLSVAAVSSAPTIGIVRRWLVRHARKQGFINIVAHERVRYGVVKRVIATCQDAGFKNVNLAVQPKPESVSSR